jgi:hypothetical protein
MTAHLIHQGTQATTTELTATNGRGPLRKAWHRIRLAVCEMNDASRRVVELQAPWSVDDQWHRR